MWSAPNHFDSNDKQKRSQEILAIKSRLGLDSYNMVNPSGLDQVEPVLREVDDFDFQKVFDLTYTNRDTFANAIEALCANNLFNKPNLLLLINSDDMEQTANNLLTGIGTAPQITSR